MAARKLTIADLGGESARAEIPMRPKGSGAWALAPRPVAWYPALGETSADAERFAAELRASLATHAELEDRRPTGSGYDMTRGPVARDAAAPTAAELASIAEWHAERASAVAAAAGRPSVYDVAALRNDRGATSDAPSLAELAERFRNRDRAESRAGLARLAAPILAARAAVAADAIAADVARKLASSGPSYVAPAETVAEPELSPAESWAASQHGLYRHAGDWRACTVPCCAIAEPEPEPEPVAEPAPVAEPVAEPVAAVAAVAAEPVAEWPLRADGTIAPSQYRYTAYASHAARDAGEPAEAAVYRDRAAAMAARDAGPYPVADVVAEPLGAGPFAEECAVCGDSGPQHDRAACLASRALPAELPGTFHVAVVGAGRRWCARDRATGSQLGPELATRRDALAYAEHRQATSYSAGPVAAEHASACRYCEPVAELEPAETVAGEPLPAAPSRRTVVDYSRPMPAGFAAVDPFGAIAEPAPAVPSGLETCNACELRPMVGPEHPGYAAGHCAACYQDATAPEPEPEPAAEPAAVAHAWPEPEPLPVPRILPAPEPASSGRPACPRCGQTFRKSGTGYAWHVANRPDCAASRSAAAA